MWRRRVRSRIDCPVRTRAGRPRPESWPALRPPGPLATETPTSPPRTPRAPQAPTAARGSWFEASPDGQEDKRKFPRSMPWTRQPTRTSQTPEVCHRRSVTLPDRRFPRTKTGPIHIVNRAGELIVMFRGRNWSRSGDALSLATQARGTHRQAGKAADSGNGGGAAVCRHRDRRAGAGDVDTVAVDCEGPLA